MIRNRKVYITIIGRKESSTKKLIVITFCVIKYWKNMQSFQTLFLYMGKILHSKNNALNMRNCLSDWKWVGYLKLWLMTLYGF